MAEWLPPRPLPRSTPPSTERALDLARLLQQIAELTNVLRIHVADGEVADPAFDPCLRGESVPPNRRRVVAQRRDGGTLPHHEYRDAMLAHRKDQLGRRFLPKISHPAAHKRELRAVEIRNIDAERHFAGEPWLHIVRIRRYDVG